jgi:hypothetical protein
MRINDVVLEARKPLKIGDTAKFGAVTFEYTDRGWAREADGEVVPRNSRQHKLLMGLKNVGIDGKTPLKPGLQQRLLKKVQDLLIGDIGQAALNDPKANILSKVLGVAGGATGRVIDKTAAAIGGVAGSVKKANTKRQKNNAEIDARGDQAAYKAQDRRTQQAATKAKKDMWANMTTSPGATGGDTEISVNPTDTKKTNYDLSPAQRGVKSSRGKTTEGTITSEPNNVDYSQYDRPTVLRQKKKRAVAPKKTVQTTEPQPESQPVDNKDFEDAVSAIKNLWGNRVTTKQAGELVRIASTKIKGPLSVEALVQYVLQNVKKNESVAESVTLTEGGSMPGTGAIHISEIEPTLKKLELSLGVSLRDRVLGSVGKREFSGDIDVAIDLQPAELDNFVKQLKSSPMILDMARSSVIMTKVRIIGYDETKETDRPRTGFVQVDFMFGDPEWLKTYYHSPAENESKYKGVYRNIMLATIASMLDQKNSKKVVPTDDPEHARPLKSERYVWSPTLGLVRGIRTPAINKKGGYLKKNNFEVIDGPWTTPKDIVRQLRLNDVSDLNSYESLHAAIEQNYPDELLQQIRQSMRDNKQVQGLGVPDDL